MDRLRRRYPWLDHLLRADESFTERYGNHYAGAIAYFSVLSLVPLLMIAFAVAGFVLAGNAALLATLEASITAAVPAGLADTVNSMVRGAIDARGTVGVLGLITALFSGIGWIRNLRDALTAQWGHEKPKLPYIKTTLTDLLALVGLGVAILLSLTVTAVGSGLGDLLLRALGLAGVGWANATLIALSVVVSLAADWLVFLWVIVRLPRRRNVPPRSAARGALLAAVGFEILQQFGGLFLAGVTRSATGALFGPIIGLLVFAYLLSYLILFATAWTVTSAESAELAAPPVPAPGPAVIRPVVRNRRGLGPVAVVGLVAVGTVAGALLGRRGDRR